MDFDATWQPINRAAALVVARGDAALAARLLMAGGQDEARGVVLPGALLATGTAVEIAAVWADFLPDDLLDHGFDDLAAVVDDVFQRQGARGAVAVAGLAETIRQLKARGLTLGVATSDSEAGARSTLAPFGVLDQFDFIAGFDSGFGGKPGPGMVKGFCRAVGLTPSQIMVVGDNFHDMEMGRNGGSALCVGVLSGTGGRDDLAPLADYIVDSIADLADLLDRVADGGGNGLA